MHDDIKQQFEELGIRVSEDVLDKCVEICLNNKVVIADFVEKWLTFSLSDLGGAEPTIENLIEMEDKVFCNKEEASSSKKLEFISNTSVYTDRSPHAIYGISTPPISRNDAKENIMDSYMYNTPKASKPAVVRTPTTKVQSLFSPVSYSPLSTTPKTHSEQSGKVVYTYGNSTLVKQVSWATNSPQQVTVKQLSVYNNKFMHSKTKFMFDSLAEKGALLADNLYDIGQALCRKKYGKTSMENELNNVNIPSQEITTLIGRIGCDTEGGKLNAVSTILVDSDELECRHVSLNFSKTKSYGIFPGQIVMVSGTNPRGEMVFVEEVHSEIVLPETVPPKITTEMKFLIASGPYTNYDDLLYEPLYDLIAHCKNNKPDVLILTGPFIEANHSLITRNILAESFESTFDKMLAGIIEKLGTDITICMVSSCKDAISNNVYPTHPISLTKTYPNVHMLPDPCIVEISGITIGVTSTDVVNHLMTEELAFNSGDKVKRIVNYLFHQQSFYPSMPPPLDMYLDSSLASKFAKLNMIPNILILPSSQKCFVRDVNGCLAINPGKLEDKDGGTFARVVVHPPKEEKNTFNYIACQILKV